MNVFAIFFKNGLKESYEFSFDTICEFLTFVIDIFLTSFMWIGITQRFGTIGNWNTFGFLQLASFAMLYKTIDAFMNGVWKFGTSIINGELDKYLARPINPWYGIIGENFGPLECIEGLLTFTVTQCIAWTIFSDNSLQLILLPLSIFLCAVGSISILCIKAIISMSAVWFGNLVVFQNLLHFEDFQFERYPTDIVGSIPRFILNYILPIGLIATFPAKVVSCTLSKGELSIISISTFTVCLFWMSIAIIVGKKALQHYESFGG